MIPCNLKFILFDSRRTLSKSWSKMFSLQISDKSKMPVSLNLKLIFNKFLLTRILQKLTDYFFKFKIDF